MVEFTVIVGSIGVSLLLLAFFLNLFKILMQDNKIYVIMNILGAGLACYASILIGFIPFVILEGTWAIVAVIGLIKLYNK
jgi:CHASE2 domain-containing sensor protein